MCYTCVAGEVHVKSSYSLHTCYTRATHVLHTCYTRVTHVLQHVLHTTHVLQHVLHACTSCNGSETRLY